MVTNYSTWRQKKEKTKENVEIHKGISKCRNKTARTKTLWVKHKQMFNCVGRKALKIYFETTTTYYVAYQLQHIPSAETEKNGTKNQMNEQWNESHMFSTGSYLQ